MKRAFVFFILFLCLSMVLVAQSSNSDQQIVGTWINENGGSRVVFNSNGTMSGNIFNRDCTKYAIAGEIIAIYNNNREASAFEFRISNDGKTLIILFLPNAEAYVFKKQ